MSYSMIEHAAQLATPLGKKARQGSGMKDLLVISDGAVIWQEGTILFTGTTLEAYAWIEQSLPPDHAIKRLDASGQTVIPGYIDPHTHFIFGGYRDK